MERRAKTSDVPFSISDYGSLISDVPRSISDYGSFISDVPFSISGSRSLG
ncbi:hypothetical protein ACIQ7N_13485 [Lysinibacillus sp. NPDC095746]